MKGHGQRHHRPAARWALTPPDSGSPPTLLRPAQPPKPSPPAPAAPAILSTPPAPKTPKLEGSANTQKGIKRFCEELIARVERAGASGVKLLRADSGFWNTKVFTLLEQAGWQYSIGVRMIKTVRAAVEAIDEHAWQRIDYPDDGEAQIAETVYDGRRLIVRRTRLIGPQAELWPDWRHFAFLTNRTEDLALVETEHRDHAIVEQVIADLKDQALAHFPSRHFYANAAWTVLGALAHNLLRWTQLLGMPETTVRTARTLRRRLLQVPGRLTRHARGWTLHLPARWPWHDDYITALTRIRALPATA
ncbi:MAG: transposase [Solirubrobacteraceae bacterium]